MILQSATHRSEKICLAAAKRGIKHWNSFHGGDTKLVHRYDIVEIKNNHVWNHVKSSTNL